jgi:ubiquitin carboxyl-terminal hydrolase 1
VNFVKDNFVGVGVMRTKCLECEASTYTKETFTNIDIPILGSSAEQTEEEDQGGPSFFTSQILSSEILRSDNKYWCSECRRLNEAQRSVSYDVLPTVLVLQLKRFTTVASKTYVSKLTDFIPTPFTLDCFCTECSRAGAGSSSRHQYRLYSVILHLGASLASGHYIAYVRAGDTSPDYLQCKRPGSADTTKTSKKRGLFKMFSKSSSLPVEAVRSQTAGGGLVCPSLGCCGLRTGQAPVEGRSSPCQPASGVNGSQEDCWLECDDEQISIISRWVT